MTTPPTLSITSEFKTIAHHAGSVWAGQLAVMAFGVTDTLVAGRHSDTALAALSVGTAIYISVYVALMTVLQALLPVWAELQGAKRFVDLGQSVRQSLYLCTIACAIGLAVLLFPGPLLRWTQVPDALRLEVERYLTVLALAFVPAMLFRLYSTLNQSLGRPLLVTALQVGALGIKIPLSIWLAFGSDAGLGFPATSAMPPMGAVGCAWATVVVYACMMLVALLMLRTQSLYIPYQLWTRLEAPDWRMLGAFARLGVPTGLAVMVEVTSFTLMALFIARMGTVASAAHQIAANLVAVLFMLPLSIGIATSARVSDGLGANRAAQVRNAITQGFMLIALTSVVMSAIIFTARFHLASLYAVNPQVVTVAAELLAWIALFHLADALQSLSSFLLRSYRIALAPLLIYAVLLWGVGLGGAYMWAYRGFGPVAARPEPSTFWICSAVALTLAAGVLMGWLARTVRQHPLTAPVPLATPLKT